MHDNGPLCQRQSQLLLHEAFGASSPPQVTSERVTISIGHERAIFCQNSSHSRRAKQSSSTARPDLEVIVVRSPRQRLGRGAWQTPCTPLITAKQRNVTPPAQQPVYETDAAAANDGGVTTTQPAGAKQQPGADPDQTNRPDATDRGKCGVFR